MRVEAVELTLASTWKGIANVPITDDLLQWPADIFALTNVILERSEAYRFGFSPPFGMSWPPSRSSNWASEVESAARQWIIRLERGEGELSDFMLHQWRALRERVDMPLEDVALGKDWRICEALLTLHAIADEACAGLGVALDRSDGEGCVYRSRGRELLARTGSLARIRPHLLCVLPKVRTPPKGTSLRSFSRYACVVGPSVGVRWNKMPAHRAGSDWKSRHVNMLLLPWPLRIRESDFRAVETESANPPQDSSGLFEFSPSEKLDLGLVSRVIRAARDEVDSIDVIVMPESALDEGEIVALEALLQRFGVVMLIAGVRQTALHREQTPGNWVHIGTSAGLQKGGFRETTVSTNGFTFDRTNITAGRSMKSRFISTIWVALFIPESAGGKEPKFPAVICSL